MPRQSRHPSGTGIYHVMMSGINHQNIFENLEDYYNAKCRRDRSVASAYQTALKKNDDMAIALALSPFARKTAELVKSGAYEAAAGSCYAIFRCLAKTCKMPEGQVSGISLN